MSGDRLGHRCSFHSNSEAWQSPTLIPGRRRCLKFASATARQHDHSTPKLNRRWMQRLLNGRPSRWPLALLPSCRVATLSFRSPLQFESGEPWLARHSSLPPRQPTQQQSLRRIGLSFLPSSFLSTFPPSGWLSPTHVPSWLCGRASERERETGSSNFRLSIHQTRENNT